MPATRRSRARWASCRRAPITLVETLADVATPRRAATPSNLAYVTQTTLSVDDTREIVEALTARFPAIVGPHKEDICYATTNRQEAVKRVAPRVDAMIVVGSPNSSNSQRLREVAERAGCPVARLVLRADDIDWAGVRRHPPRSALTAGASAPEMLVEEIIDAFAARFEVHGRDTSRPPTRACSSRCRGRCAARRRNSTRGGLHRGLRRGARGLPRRLRPRRRCSPSRASPRASRTPTIFLHTERRHLHPDALREARARGRPAVLPRR